MKFEHINLIENQSFVWTIELNRPEVRNALNTKMAQEISEAICILSSQKARALIITGAEDKAFCAGADLKERSGMNMNEWRAQHKHFEAVVSSIEKASFPVIASVNGAAFGGGLEIILSCDFAYARASQKMSFSEVKLGIIPGLGGIYRLSKVCSISVAKELIQTGAIFTSEEARGWGIINKVFESSRELQENTFKAALQIASNAPLAVSASKKALDLSQGLDINSWTKSEHELYYELVESQDRKEGIEAFTEKRKAVFKGR